VAVFISKIMPFMGEVNSAGYGHFNKHCFAIGLGLIYNMYFPTGSSPTTGA
jgi:hypothetical protein